MPSTTQTIRNARKMGLVSAIAFIVLMLLEIPLAIYPNILALDFISFVVALVCYGAYTYFLYGLVVIGREAKTRLEKTAKLMVILSATCSIISALSSSSFVPENISIVLSLIIWAYLVVFGLLSLRLAKDIKELEPSIGITAAKAAKWNKIAGYLMVSVILSPLGALLSLVTDYKMWRMQGEFLKKETGVS